MRILCPACGENKVSKSGLAILSPWVRDLANVKERSTKYCICDFCGTGYVVLSYSEKQLSLLYGGYRGSNYQEKRESWEPSYTKNLNDSLDFGHESLAHRKNQLDMTIDSAVSGFSSIAQVVVDIGGGHGGVIPDWVNLNHKFVLDVSSTTPAEGIVRIDSWSDLKRVRIDFVMVCGILEHLNDPINFLNELVLNVKEINSQYDSKTPTLFYLEVPAGIPALRSKCFQTIALFAANFKCTWRVIGELQTKKWAKMGPLRIAEHLQFFSPTGFSMLAERAGLTVLRIEEYEGTFGVVENKGLKFASALTLVASLQI